MTIHNEIKTRKACTHQDTCQIIFRHSDKNSRQLSSHPHTCNHNPQAVVEPNENTHKIMSITHPPHPTFHGHHQDLHNVHATPFDKNIYMLPLAVNNDGYYAHMPKEKIALTESSPPTPLHH